MTQLLLSVCKCPHRSAFTFLLIALKTPDLLPPWKDVAPHHRHQQRPLDFHCANSLFPSPPASKFGKLIVYRRLRVLGSLLPNNIPSQWIWDVLGLECLGSSTIGNCLPSPFLLPNLSLLLPGSLPFQMHPSKKPFSGRSIYLFVSSGSWNGRLWVYSFTLKEVT